MNVFEHMAEKLHKAENVSKLTIYASNVEIDDDARSKRKQDNSTVIRCAWIAS